VFRSHAQHPSSGVGNHTERLERIPRFDYDRTMKDGPNIVGIAALIGDRARADILTALMGDHALTATELAQVADVTKQTISAHLSKLLGAQLLAVESQGRHRYYRLADHDVAQLLENLMGVAFRTGAVRARLSPREPTLRKARVCYDHLAGDLGVEVYESLQKGRALISSSEGPQLTSQGRTLLRDLGIDLDALSNGKRALCRTCLDWSVRRHHLAGALGAALLDRYCELGWARRAKGTRVVQFSPRGEKALRAFIH
jgi:DNA-binding transcriptional ArsR family regulator